MPFDGDKGTALIPRATVEEIVGYRNRALELYRDAFTAIENADAALKAAHAMAAQAAGGAEIYVSEREHNEVAEFQNAVKLPNSERFQRVARRLTDMRVWQWVIQRTDLERLMDKEAKDKLREQMRYLPDRWEGQGAWNAKRGEWDKGQLILPEEIGEGMPPVTVDNIYATIQQFALDADSIFRRGIANAFSKLDRRFKSHDGFKLGSRIILKYAFSSYSGSLQYGGTSDTLLDIERAFTVLDNEHLGASYGGAVGALYQDRQGGHYGPKQSTTHTKYFKIQGYMNGNAHLWFTRDDLVEKVNKILAEWYGEVIGDAHDQGDIFENRKTTPARRFGFFPTPDGAAETLIGKVPLWRKAGEPPLTILEPSAGTGNLARRCALAGHVGSEWRKAEDPPYPYNHKVDCVEIQPKLARELRAERIYRKVYCADFLQMKPDPRRLYDRIVMNPPFDLERDIDHITHAMKFLKPDGYLCAIVSAGTEFRETKKATAFRALVKSKGGRFDDLPAGSFSSVGTNVNTMMVQIRNDGRSVHW